MTKGKMTTQHTPGPWEVSYESAGNGESNILIVKPGSNLEIACVIDEAMPSNQAAANARLIAAAPEMLALLKSVPPINGSDAQTEMEWNWKLEALLAKIEGV